MQDLWGADCGCSALGWSRLSSVACREDWSGAVCVFSFGDWFPILGFLISLGLTQTCFLSTLCTLSARWFVHICSIWARSLWSVERSVQPVEMPKRLLVLPAVCPGVTHCSLHMQRLRCRLVCARLWLCLFVRLGFPMSPSAEEYNTSIQEKLPLIIGSAAAGLVFLIALVVIIIVCNRWVMPVMQTWTNVFTCFISVPLNQCLSFTILINSIN